MCADIAERSCAQERITDGMREDVAVGVANRTFIERESDAADDERAAFGKAVQIVADAAADAASAGHRRALMDAPSNPKRHSERKRDSSLRRLRSE